MLDCFLIIVRQSNETVIILFWLYGLIIIKMFSFASRGFDV